MKDWFLYGVAFAFFVQSYFIMKADRVRSHTEVMRKSQAAATQPRLEEERIPKRILLTD